MVAGHRPTTPEPRSDISLVYRVSAARALLENSPRTEYTDMGAAQRAGLQEAIEHLRAVERDVVERADE